MMYALKKEYDELDLDPQLGDAAFCLVDSDVDPAKDSQLERADAESDERTELVVSSPCFEIWYLCHFSASTRQYSSNNEILKALKQYIPDYRKEMTGIWELLESKTELAVKNAKTLEQRCLEKGLRKHCVSFTPSTEIYKIFELLTK